MRPKRARLVLTLVTAALLATHAGAVEKTECDRAIERFDAAYSGKSDDTAFAAAQALVKTCAKPDGAHARALSRLGIVHFGRKDVVEAAVAFEAAAELNPKDAILRMNVCGALTELKRHEDAIAACEAGLEIAKAKDDGTPDKHGDVLKLGFNLALAKVRRARNICSDRTIYDAFEAFRVAHPDHGWVHQMVGAWYWDCEDDFDKGFAMYKKSCALGHEASCEQVRYTESCRCETRLKDV